MTIDPLFRPGVSQPEAPRTQESRRGEATSGASASPGTAADSEASLPSDSVQLSPEALQLARGESIPSGGFTPQRLKEIGQSLARASHDAPDVQRTAAERLASGIPVPVGWGALG